MSLDVSCSALPHAQQTQGGGRRDRPRRRHDDAVHPIRRPPRRRGRDAAGRARRAARLPADLGRRLHRRGNTGLDTGVWRYDAGLGANFGTGEIETTTTSTANVYQDGQGHLVLKALHDGTDPATGWTSGRVETQADGWGAPDGGVVRIESSLKQPDVTTSNGLGYWPAYWMVGSPLRIGIAWPGSGEVDMMENINGHDSLFSTLHCGVLDATGGPCHEYTGIGSGERACAGCKTGYHTYAAEIDRSTNPEQIRYYLDGNNFFTINSTQVDATTWANAVHHNWTPIYDLAIGGQFPAAFGGGPTAATVSAGHLDVDYIAVYNKPPAAQSGWGTNVAAGKPATASSTEASFVAGNVTDNNPASRWSSAAADPQWVQTDLGQNYNLNHVSLNWESAAASNYTVQISTNGTTWTTAATKTGGTSEHINLPVSGTARYVRVNGTARQSTFGYSLYDLKVWSTDGGTTTTPPTGTPTTPPAGSNTLLTQGRPATASSTESTSFPAANAVDGDTGTRWSSAFSDPQSLQVDLGATHQLGQVVLNWETAAASTYQIQTSNDATNWTTLYTATNGTGGVTDDPGLRFRTVRPDQRHRPHHPVRLLALGIPGLRHLNHSRGEDPARPSPREVINKRPHPPSTCLIAAQRARRVTRATNAVFVAATHQATLRDRLAVLVIVGLILALEHLTIAGDDLLTACTIGALLGLADNSRWPALPRPGLVDDRRSPALPLHGLPGGCAPAGLARQTIHNSWRGYLGAFVALLFGVVLIAVTVTLNGSVDATDGRPGVTADQRAQIDDLAAMFG